MSVPLPPDVDPARARVILLGAESFPLMDAARAKRKLAPLSKEAFRNSAGEFAKYLCDPHPTGFGLADPATQILSLFDADPIGPAQINTIRKYLAEADPAPTDVVVYYVGHGQPKASGYYLCVKNTEDDALDTTAIRAQELVRVLGQAIDRSGFRLRVYLFFDACFSAFPFEGQAVGEPDRHHLKGLPSKGMAALCSSGKDQLSISPEGWPLTLYTHALLDTLREPGWKPAPAADGEAEAEEEEERVSLNCLRDRMWEKIPHLYPSDPVKPRLFNPKQDHGLVDRVGLFPNPRYVARPPSAARRLPDDLRSWWAEDGPEEAVVRLESRMGGTAAADWIGAAKWLAEVKGSPGVVFLFSGLSHADPDVAAAAVAAVKSIGWDALTAAVIARMEREGDPDVARTILTGARAYPADEWLVQFLRKVSRVFPAKLAPLVGDLIELKDYRLRDDTFRVEFNARNTQYRIDKAIGLGPITVAYLGWERTSREAVVVRVLKADFARRPEVTAAFLELARLARLTGNQYAQRVYAFSTPEEDAVYLVRSFAEGSTLREDYAGGNRLTPPDVVVLLRNLAEAIRPFHDRDCCHGGIRPANIFITLRHPFYLLGDPSPFRSSDGDPTGTVSGPPDRMTDDARYTAPEAFLDPPSPAADLYSLGCVAFFALCGRPPFESNNRNRLMFDHRDTPGPRPSAFGSLAGPLADGVVLRLMAKKPGDRYASIDDLIDDLKALRKAIAGGSPPPAPAPPSSPQSGPPPSPGGAFPHLRGPDPTDRPIEAPALPAVLQPGIPNNSVASVARHLPPDVGATPRAVGPIAVMNLVVEWELARGRGAPVSVEVLCPDDPELRAELNRWISVRLAREAESAPATSMGGGFTVAPANVRRAADRPMVSIARPPSTLGASEAYDPRTGTLAQDSPQSVASTGPLAIGQYRILQELGRGGMGQVYRAIDPRLNREVALKVMSKYGHDPIANARFQIEARALARIEHPGVCPIYDFGESDGVPYFTMPLLRGGTLDRRIRNGEPLSAHEVMRLIADVARTMAFVHGHRIIHRDLKPSNIMLSDSGFPMVMDFGLARGSDIDTGDTYSSPTMAGAIMGTPGYMSPEQATGDQKRIGPLSDVFSLGCIMYEMLSGARAFAGEHIHVILAKIMTFQPPPPSSLLGTEAKSRYGDAARRLDDLCLRMLSKNPAVRPTMEEVADELWRADRPEADGPHREAPPRKRAWLPATFNVSIVILLILWLESAGAEYRMGNVWFRIVLLYLPMALAITYFLPRLIAWILRRD